jgi:LmbE family N-acetylglucosaminyl deacetylase
MTIENFPAARLDQRELEIRTVNESYGFSSLSQLSFPSARLDQCALSDIVSAIGAVFLRINPTIAYLPYRGDVHSDHAAVFDATAACCKWFRYPSLRRVLAYETPSETDFGIDPDANGFRPNVFVNIERWYQQKLEIMALYKGEQGDFPFPRSVDAIHSLARVRGSASGFGVAEAFMLLRDRV